MKKVLLYVGGAILFLFVVVVVVLFTPPGNAIVKPIVQSQIDKYAPLKLDLEKFSLGFSSVDVLIRHNDALIITLGGNFSLFSQNLDLVLKVDAKDISAFGELADTPLQGSFVIDTTAKGAFNALQINTTSDIAKSFTDISVFLQDYFPTNIVAHIKDLQIQEVLAMAGMKPYMSGALNIQADIKGNEDMIFNGNSVLSIAQGLVDSKLIKKDFDIEVPRTTFALNQISTFAGNQVNQEFNFDSNIGKIYIGSEATLPSLDIKSTYDISLSDLSALTPLVGMPIRGSFATEGNISGNALEELKVEGSSNVADSDTTYSVLLKNNAPHSAMLKSQNLRVDTLLWMIHKPRYATMKLNVESKVSDFDKNISTDTTIKLNGTTNNAVMRQEFDMDMPATNFALDSVVALKQGVGKADSTLTSSIATLKLPDTQINIKDFGLTIPYEAIIHDLKKLKFVTGAELAGDIKAQGKAKIADSVYADFNTTSLGGSIDAKLENNKLVASLKGLNTLKLFTMAQIKPVFSSSINGNLDYDTLTQKGTLKAVLSNGKLMQSELTDLAVKYLKTDITKETYEDAGLNASINGKKITTDIGLKSNNTVIAAQGASIDLEKDLLNADLKFQIKDKYIYLKARNKLSSPDISIDAKDLIKAEAGKAISKQADKAIDKYLKDDKARDGAKKLLNKIFN